MKINDDHPTIFHYSNIFDMAVWLYEAFDQFTGKMFDELMSNKQITFDEYSLKLEEG
jgi:hypothetical protein